MKFGEDPTLLEACFFSRAVFQKIGKFDPNYEVRGDFDLFCRFLLNGTMQSSFTTRVLIDYDEKNVTRQEMLQQFEETWKIIYRNFGFADSMKWLLVQNDFDHFMTLTLKGIKNAFVGS